jgi:hypothetical protein
MWICVENDLVEVLSRNTEPTALRPRSFYLHIFPLRYSLMCVSNLAFFSTADPKLHAFRSLLTESILYKNCFFFFFCTVLSCLPAKSYYSLLKSTSCKCPIIANRTAEEHHIYHTFFPAFCIFKSRRSTCENYTVPTFL